eukprot:7742922-Pyramimonas_sp.AAC.1
MLTLLLDDMRQMWQTGNEQEKLTARQLFQLRGDIPELAEPWLRWLADLEPRCLRRVLTYGGETDAVTDVAAILWLERDVRGQKCKGGKGLANHKHAAHK